MLDLEKIGKFIAKIRIEKNMTQQELADRLFVSHQAVSKWENGKTLPNIDIMALLTKLFDITIDQLINTDDEINQDLPTLLKTYPRNYVLNLLIKGKIENKLEEVIYLFSIEEREILISHIINNNIVVDIYDLLPYLNPIERKRIINSIKDKKIKVNINDLLHMLTYHEKNILIKEDKNEH